MNLQKKAGGFRQTFAKKSKSDRNEDGWQKSVIEILRENSDRLAEEDERSFAHRAEDRTSGRSNLLYDRFLQHKNTGDPPGMQKVSRWTAGYITK